MGNEKERRKSPRVQLKLSFSVTCEDTVVAGELIDLSNTGICFKSKFEFEQDSNLFLALPNNEEKEIKARIIRCEKLPYNYHQVAASFANGEEPSLINLVKFTKGDLLGEG